MTRASKTYIWILAAVALAVAGAVATQVISIWKRRWPVAPLAISGAVLRQDSDPERQSPLPNAKITAAGGLSVADGVSDASGLFNLTLRPSLEPGRTIVLRVEHPDYRPVEITGTPDDRIYVVRMEPAAAASVPTPQHAVPPGKPIPGKLVEVEHVQVRYSFKEQTTNSVGSVAKQFQVVNTGNVPCKSPDPCSPDGRWKARQGSLLLDAEKGNELRNVRVSCVAGPCPFTKIDAANLTRPGRTVTISVLNWSDTATFLAEAEVSRVMVTDTVRRSYPFIVGDTMSFALPATSEGPSVEAEMNAEHIVFPLGPKLVLSWATCSVEIGPDRNKVYRCELKPGYQFGQEARR